MILSLQCCKLHKKDNKSTQEWMPEYNYKENDRRLKEQFINDIDDEEITQEIITIVYSVQVLMWVQRVEVQGAQKKC